MRRTYGAFLLPASVDVVADEAPVKTFLAIIVLVTLTTTGSDNVGADVEI